MRLAALLVAVPLAAYSQENAPPPAEYAPPPQEYAPPPPQYTPPPPQQQYPPNPSYSAPQKQRGSWYIGFGLGSGGGVTSANGTTYTFTQMNLERTPSNGFFNFKVGWTATPHLLIGLDYTEMLSFASDGVLTSAVDISNYDVVATWFPSGRGFFVRGGLGRSVLGYSIQDSLGSGTLFANGFNVLGGVGYAFWLGRSFNLTLNLDYSVQAYEESVDNYDSSNFWATWIGFDWY